MDEGRNLFDLGWLLADLKDELQQDVDVVEARCVHPYIRQRVLAEAVYLQKRPGAMQDVDLADGSTVRQYLDSPHSAPRRQPCYSTPAFPSKPFRTPEHKQITTTQI